jgi:hypothetical protein
MEDEEEGEESKRLVGFDVDLTRSAANLSPGCILKVPTCLFSRMQLLLLCYLLSKQDIKNSEEM